MVVGGGGGGWAGGLRLGHYFCAEHIVCSQTPNHILQYIVTLTANPISQKLRSV